MGNSNSGSTDVQSRSDFLWKVIARFDTYIGSTNTKAALIGTFATFVLGTVVLKWKDVADLFAAHPKLTIWAALFVGLAAAASLVSLGFAFVAVHPFLFSPKKPGAYHSDIFFMHVLEHASGDDYFTAFNGHDEAARLKDLANQVHAMACGVGSKMKLLQKAVIATVVALAGIFGLIVCLLIKAIL